MKAKINIRKQHCVDKNLQSSCCCGIDLMGSFGDDLMAAQNAPPVLQALGILSPKNASPTFPIINIC